MIRRYPILPVVGVSLSLFSIACGALREPAVTPPPEPPPVAEASAALDPLYADLELAARDYEAAIELLAQGATEGRERMDTARARIRSGAASCAQQPGCDVGRFLEVLDTLFDQQGRLLAEQIEADSAEGPAVAAEGEGWMEDGEEEAAVDVSEAVPELARSAALLRGSDLRERIQLNPFILGEIEDWLTWRRPMLMEAWTSFHYLRDEISPIYEQAGLPEALLFAMIATESGGKAHATSRAGAAGILQFMRLTGRRFGLGVDRGFDQRFDPAAATRAAVAYLDEQFGVLNNDLEKALAAYNGGEGRMRGLHRRNADASFWDRRIYGQLPRETRDYVPRILAAAWLFLHSAEYNVEWPRLDDGDTTSLALERAASLSELAICLGQAGGADDGWFRILRNANPRLESTERQPVGTRITLPSSLVDTYRDRCVADTALIARVEEVRSGASKARAMTPRPAEKEFQTYRVAQGDTLSRIASRSRCTSVRELGSLNNIRAPRYQIRVGQRLKVPVCRG